MKRAGQNPISIAAANEILRQFPGIEEKIPRSVIAQVVDEAIVASAVGEKTVHVNRPVLESTPLAKQARMEWICILEPWARSVRERVFGSADPPFSSEKWGRAVAWIEEETRREVEEVGDVEAVMESEEYRERKERALADADWLAECSSIPFALTVVPVPIFAYMKPRRRRVSLLIRDVVGQVAAAVERMPEDEGITVTDLAGRMKVERSIVLERVAQARKAGYLKNVENRKGRPHRLRPANPIPEASEDAREDELATCAPMRRGGHLMTLAVTAEAMAAVSGFEPYEVTAFLLAGTQPSVTRTRVRGSFVLRFRPPTPEEIAKGERVREIARMKQRLDAALEEAGVSFEEAEKVLATLLNRPAESKSNEEVQPPRAVDLATAEHLIRAPRVTVEFYTRDIRNEDLQKLRGEIHQAWAALRNSEPEAVGRIREEARRGAREDARAYARAHGLPVSASKAPPRGRFTEKDRQLSEIIKGIGGEPDKPSADFWEKVRQRWVEAGQPPTHADVLRRRWGRMKAKGWE